MKFSKLLAATALASAFAAPTGAFAQTVTAAAAGAQTANADTTEDDAKRSAEADQVVVTGSRINRPNMESNAPITSVTAAELLSRGNVSLGDLLNQLPQLRSTFSQANSTRFIGTAGINAIDLRGLGTARTLVLLDGRRIVTATPGINRPDINTIPQDLLERTDLLTGGNSAIYGADAVAGVVNFVLKQDFQGLRVRAQGGTSDRGDRGSYFASITAGQNFSEGRGNVSFAFEYAQQDTLYNADRDFQTGAYSGRNQFNLVQNTGPQLNPSNGPIRTTGEPQAGDGIPDNAFFRGVRNNTISEGGLFTAACPTVAAATESAAAFNARRAAACSGLPDPSSSNALAQFGRTFVFNSDGTLTPNNCIQDFRPFGSGNCLGGQGSTLRQNAILVPGLDRLSFFLQGRYEFSPAFVPYFQAQFVRVNANQEGQPTFFNNSFSINNPFLTTQARNTLLSVLAPGATTFTAQRFNIDFGGRGEQHRRDQYRAVVGIRGTFNDDWKYDISFNYGHLYTFYATQGNINRQRYANSINAVRNAAGNIVCGINADANPANDDPACVPVNLFGDRAPSREALNYFGYTSTRVQKADLYNVVGYVAGDSSQLFSMQGGPVAFVIGGEYRSETAYAAYDPFTSSTACGTAGCTFLNVIPDFRPPAQSVKEGFIQINLPVLKDLPFAKQLEFEFAGRVSDYNLGRTGTVFTYNITGTWAPARDFRVRASYARAVRAPTQSDLFSPLTQTFLNGLVDPCGQQNINNNPNRVRNCAAAGVPTTQTFNGTTEPFTNRPASGISGFNGSNPILSAEKSESFTAGFVFQPSFIPGLSLTMDYYRIIIKDSINALAAQTIINQCYDNPSGINNPFCASIFRNPNGTFAGQNDVQHGGTTVSLTPTGPSFISGPFNYAKNINSGIDADLNYRTKLGGDWTLTARALASKSFERWNFTDINDPRFALRQLGNLGDPEWQAQFSLNVSTKTINMGYRLRYYGKQTIAAYQSQNVVQGRAPENPDVLPFAFYPDITYSDFRIDWTVEKNKRFYVGVDNAFDQLPPLDLIGNEVSPYDPIGRSLFAGIEIKF